MGYYGLNWKKTRFDAAQTQQLTQRKPRQQKNILLNFYVSFIPTKECFQWQKPKMRVKKRKKSLSCLSKKREWLKWKRKKQKAK